MDETTISPATREHLYRRLCAAQREILTATTARDLLAAIDDVLLLEPFFSDDERVAARAGASSAKGGIISSPLAHPAQSSSHATTVSINAGVGAPCLSAHPSAEERASVVI